MSLGPSQQGAFGDVEQMFDPSVTPGSGAGSGAGGGGMGGGGGGALNRTLDEPVMATLLRDLRRVADNVRLVTLPMASQNDPRQALRDWDLWGPLLFTLLLGTSLSWGSPDPSQVFAMVFLIISVGAVVLTLNVLLLGGSIMFFQSLCLLGYCLFPLSLSSFVCIWVGSKIVRSILLLAGIVWASYSAVPFVGSSVPHQRKVLAVYPLMLLYVALGWLALVRA